MGGQTYVRTIFGPATPHEEELFRVALTGAVQAVLSLPVGVKDLQARLMVCVYIGNEHRGKTPTLQVLRGYRVGQAWKMTLRIQVRSACVIKTLRAGILYRGEWASW